VEWQGARVGEVVEKLEPKDRLASSRPKSQPDGDPLPKDPVLEVYFHDSGQLHAGRSLH
jgi:hypothetical protein